MAPQVAQLNKWGQTPFVKLALVALLAAPAWAAKEEEPANRTYWDQLMEGQAHRSLWKGAQLLEGGDYERAAQEFSKAVIARPQDADAHRMLGVAYYWTGRVDRAEEEFLESRRLQPASAQTHLLLGIVHAWRGDMEKAYASFVEADKLEPQRPDIQMNLGSIEETMGRFTEALVHYRRAVELSAKHPLYPFQLATLYRRLGRDDEAIEQLERAVKLFPEFEDALLELGALQEKKGERKKAEELFERSVRLKHRDAVARFRLARIHLLAGRIDKAQGVLRDAFHLTPADRAGGLALSLAFGGPRQGGSGESRTAEDAPAGGAGKPEAEEPQGPLDLLARNLKRIPLDQDAVLQVDVAFLPRPKVVSRQGGEAPSGLKRALEAAGKPPAGVLGARREFKLGAASKAQRLAQIQAIAEDLKKVLDGAPPDSETRFGMNLSFSETSSKPAAQEGSAARAQYQPRDVGNDLGLWVKGTGWMALVEEALTMPGEEPPQPRSADWWVVEGIGHSTMGHGARAAESFRKALALDPRNELALLGMGLAHVLAGDEPGAVAHYRKALEVNPKNQAASDGLKWLLAEPVDRGDAPPISEAPKPGKRGKR